jgi:putative SOS response-associated peptidase YedK
MCTNYRPATRELAARMFDFPAPAFDYPDEAYPGYVAPAARRSSLGRLEWLRGRFGLIPYWAKDASFGRRTYNARSETVAAKPAFRQAWQRSQRALVPMACFYEPDWQTGRAVRWRIERRDRAPFAVAALWDRWVAEPGAEVVESFSLLTINADGHPVMGRFHRPGDEKRSLVPLEPAQWGAWLDEDPDTALLLLTPMQPELFAAEADPRPPSVPSPRVAPRAPGPEARPGTEARQLSLAIDFPGDDG